MPSKKQKLSSRISKLEARLVEAEARAARAESRLATLEAQSASQWHPPWWQSPVIYGPVTAPEFREIWCDNQATPSVPSVGTWVTFGGEEIATTTSATGDFRLSAGPAGASLHTTGLGRTWSLEPS